jgi:hypothetical protein
VPLALRFALPLGFAFFAVSVLGQRVQTEGVQTEWDARKNIDELKLKALSVPPVLERFDVAKWRAAGAPEAYIGQLDGAKRQLVSTAQALQELRQTPEKLSVALEIFLRLQALQNMLDATVEAARKYESPEAADLLQEKLSEIAPSRDRFQSYMLDLASERDKQLEVLLKEAQRCRVEVNRPPVKK